MAAFRLAVEMGADMIEMDLHQSLDGQLVVIHDRSLRRTAGSRRLVGSMTLDAIRKLDAGAWFHPRFTGQRIPTLLEVLDQVPEDVGLNLEIKKAIRPYRDLEKNLLQLLGRHKRMDRFLVSSFDTGILERIRRLEPRIRLGFNFKRGLPGRMMNRAERLGVESIHGKTVAVSDEHIRLAHRHGIRIYVFTVEDLAAMRHWLDRGVDGIFTGYPDRLQGLIRLRRKAP